MRWLPSRRDGEPSEASVEVLRAGLRVVDDLPVAIPDPAQIGLGEEA